MTAPARPPRSRRSGRLPPSPAPSPRAPARAELRLVGGLEALIDEFCRRYPNPKTAADYRSELGKLFALTGRSHPRELTEADLIGFCTAGRPANNTMYQRRSKAATFLGWCLRQGVIDDDPSADLLDRHSPLRTYRRTYGKVQAANPGRWLTHQQAYGQLVAACADGTIVGVRDEIVIRLGLLGMRLAEIAGLDVGALRMLPTISWTGKGHKPRRMVAGPALRTVLERYLATYPSPEADDPLICRQVMGARRQGGPSRLDWGHRASSRSLFVLVTARAQAAGLGHVAPHDLRRSAAGILHNSLAADGGHRFDLLDIQRVLGHSDPATIMRSYLEPMDTDVIERAASVLD